MNKPKNGYSREIYDILEEHGPINYYTIRRHLIKRGSEMRPKQARTALNNLMGRRFVQRNQSDVRRYEICAKQSDAKGNSIISPVTERPISDLTRQLIRQAPPIELLFPEEAERVKKLEAVKTSWKDIDAGIAQLPPTPEYKTPESAEITPTEGLFGMNLKDSAIVIVIAVITSALTTTILEIL